VHVGPVAFEDMDVDDDEALQANIERPNEAIVTSLVRMVRLP
jgi:hypothetical protein